MSASLHMKFDVIAGTHAQHAARALARIAQQLWVLTEANFNGTRMFANPGETGDAVYLRWTVDSSDGDAHQTSDAPADVFADMNLETPQIPSTRAK